MDLKKILPIAVVVLILIGGVLWWVNSGRIETQEEVTPTVEKEVYETISPEELGLTLKARSDKKAVIMEVTRLDGITMIDYELSYLAKGDIPRGVIGSIQVKSSDKKISRELLLGTCSRNVCKYDEGVTSVKLIAKVTKTDGKIFQSELSEDL